MGREISHGDFSVGDYRHFCRKLRQNLQTLDSLLQRPDFGHCPDTLGAELELCMVDSRGRPVPRNRHLLQAVGDPRLTLELNRYNVEYNFEPLRLGGDCFSRFESNIVQVLARLNAVAAQDAAHVLPVGILPTLQDRDLGQAMMTDELRYRLLAQALRTMRKRAFEINIDGDDPFTMVREDLTAEGCCTSFQIHYSFDIREFVDSWNAMTLVTPVVLGLAANSPLLLGHRLWHETRIPLFKQSIDGRNFRPRTWQQPARVAFGQDWLRHSPYELFARMVYLYPPLIPLIFDESPAATAACSGLPGLQELCLHNGTVWQWNRPIYDSSGSGHIRLEMRALPAGPTALDMVANAAFYVGLVVALRPRVEALIDAMPHSYVVANFYRAAREGMAARLVWPSLRQNRLKDRPLCDIALTLLDDSRSGLAELGVSTGDIDRYLAVISGRISSGRNGARWQLDTLAHWEKSLDRPQALQKMLQLYRLNVASQRPVADWEVPS